MVKVTKYIEWNIVYPETDMDRNICICCKIELYLLALIQNLCIDSPSRISLISIEVGINFEISIITHT